MEACASSAGSQCAQNMSQAFSSFQNYLREHGGVDLAQLEEDIRQLLSRHLLKQKLKAQELDELAILMLLRYCIGWAVASTEDLPPLFEDDRNLATGMMKPHREQMARYASEFSSRWGALLTNPDENLDAKTVRSLERLVQRRHKPKAAVYVPELLFAEPSEMNGERTYVAKRTTMTAGIWGKDNIKALTSGTRRARYRMERLVAQTRVGTGGA